MPDIRETASSSLGDCILHLDHHEMRPECWRVLIDRFMAFADAHPELDLVALHAAGADAYKADYERDLLNAVRSEVADA